MMKYTILLCSAQNRQNQMNGGQAEYYLSSGRFFRYAIQPSWYFYTLGEFLVSRKMFIL
jgi:hypothetical protein